MYIVAQLRLSKTTTPPLSSLPSPPIPTQPSSPRGGSPHCWILWTKLRWDLRYHPLEGRDPIHGQVFAAASTGIIIIRGIVGGGGGRKDLSRENLLLVYYYYARRCVVPFLIRSFATRMRWFRIETIIYIYLFRIVRKISKNLLASEWSENAWRRKKIREIREKGLKTVFHRFISFEGGGEGGLCCELFSRNFSPSFPLLRCSFGFRGKKKKKRRKGKKGFSSSRIRRKFREGKHAIRSISLSELGIPSGIPLPLPRILKTGPPTKAFFPFFFSPPLFLGKFDATGRAC